MAVISAEDEAAMDAILQEASQGGGEEVRRCSSWDDERSTGEGKQHQQHGHLRHKSSANSWDTDSEEGDGTCTAGPVHAVDGTGSELRFATFAAAAMSSRLPAGAVIHLPPGVHRWPGGDLNQSVAGSPVGTTVITGNEGCGYFFYLRRSGTRLSNLVLRGSTRGRAHLYIDQLSDVTVNNVVFEGSYNNCVQILGSSDVTVQGCVLQQAEQSPVTCKQSSRVRIVGNRFAGCTPSVPLVAFYACKQSVARLNKLCSKSTSIFDARACSTSDVLFEENTVEFTSPTT